MLPPLVVTCARKTRRVRPGMGRWVDRATQGQAVSGGKMRRAGERLPLRCAGAGRKWEAWRGVQAGWMNGMEARTGRRAGVRWVEKSWDRWR